MLKQGDMAPEFDLPTYGGQRVRLADFRGKHVVLYFYPKDLTPGCTIQACDFTARKDRFEGANTVVLGVSRDPVSLHEKFRDKHGLNFPLLADEDGKVCEAYGVWREKNLYGNKSMGIVRTTFVIGPDGRLEKVYEGVRADGHADVLLQDLGGEPMSAPAEKKPAKKRAAKKTAKKTGKKAARKAGKKKPAKKAAKKAAKKTAKKTAKKKAAKKAAKKPARKSAKKAGKKKTAGKKTKGARKK